MTALKSLDLNEKRTRYKHDKLIVASVAEIERETQEHMLNKKIKGRLDYIKKNGSFLGLVKTWQVKALQVAAALSDYIPEAEKRLEVKQSISSKIGNFRNDNVPITKRQYSR